MAAPWQGLPVRLERAPHRGAAFALSNASKRARTRSIGSGSRSSAVNLAPAVRHGCRSAGLACPLGSSTAAGSSVRHNLQTIHMLQASTERDLDGVFSTLIQQRVGGLVITADTFFSGKHAEVAA